ncbi:MAG: glycerol-3-phosphate dehydrogenase/oxidase, partial [bacterium]|nr:glycerol-3-phosphate dehydrogenase/oxidase [bacterium]
MELDLIVIGGGVNGCGIARDAAMRGLKCALIERNDFGAETTNASSRMIHGGARYLFSNRKTTKLSSIDSGAIQKIAPHLLFRIPFIFPVLKKPGWPDWARRFYLELLETLFENYDGFRGYKNSKKHTRLGKDQVLALEPDLTEDVLGAVTFDEWGIDTNRLCIHNVISAEEHGAQAFNHTEVTKILKEGGRVVGVWTRDRLTGEALEFRAKMVVNATGPWCDRLAQLAGCRVPLRPAKGVHLSFDRRLTNYAVLARAIDDRSIFLMPYQNTTIAGTTDDDYFGDPGDIPLLEDEVEYLLEGIGRVFPRIREARMTHAWAGVRPTLYKRGPYEDDLSRDHKIFDHSESENTPGFLSLAGGKLASYRLMSEELVDVVMKKLGKAGECRTHLEPLPGAERKVEAQDLVKQFGIDLYAANRLVYRYGGRAYEVLDLSRDAPRYRNITCSCDPILEAELRYALRKEKAKSLEDLRRRTRLSLGPCQG